VRLAGRKRSFNLANPAIRGRRGSGTHLLSAGATHKDTADLEVRAIHTAPSSRAPNHRVFELRRATAWLRRHATVFEGSRGASRVVPTSRSTLVPGQPRLVRYTPSIAQHPPQARQMYCCSSTRPGHRSQAMANLSCKHHACIHEVPHIRLTALHDTARLQRRCLHVYASDGGHFRSPRSEHITCDDTLLRDTAWASHHAMHTAPNTQPCTHSNTLPSLMSTMRQSDTRTPDTTSILHGTTQATQRFWCAHHGRCPNPTLALLTQLPHG
jgi:hypothetical protein